jgi:hypothetical protein
MAKDYKKGHQYRLYLNTATWASPTYVQIKAVDIEGYDINPDDIEVPESGSDMGHLHGEKDPQIRFRLLEDSGDSNVETLIANLHDGTLTSLALARGNIATTGVKYVRMECVLRAPLGAARADASSFDVTAMRHANSDQVFTRGTAA